MFIQQLEIDLVNNDKEYSTEDIRYARKAWLPMK